MFLTFGYLKHFYILIQSVLIWEYYILRIIRMCILRPFRDLWVCFGWPDLDLYVDFTLTSLGNILRFSNMQWKANKQAKKNVKYCTIIINSKINLWWNGNNGLDIQPSFTLKWCQYNFHVLCYRTTLRFDFLHLLWSVCKAMLFRYMNRLVTNQQQCLRFISACRFVLYIYACAVKRPEMSEFCASEIRAQCV